MTHPDLLFVPYQTTLDLLGVEDAMRICEDVYRMHHRGSVTWTTPANFRLDTGAPLHNHWHVKGVLLADIPTTGVRMYNYYDDGVRNTVGYLDCLRYIALADPRTGHALALVDEHWSYAIRSTAAAVVALKYLGPAEPRVLGLVGIGTMGTNALRCLLTLYRFTEIRCTSRRPETREAFARKWSEELGIPVRAVATAEEVARGADIVVGGTTSSDIMCREEWLKPGAVFISLARRELDPAGWARMDKVVVDSWDINMLTGPFRTMVESGQFSRDQLYGEIQEVIAGAKPGRTRPDERILVATTGLVSQDVAIAHWLFEAAKAKGLGIWLPAARSNGGGTMTKMRIARREILRGAAALGIGGAASGLAAGLAMPRAAFAQSFPTRPIKWMCYQAAGGTMDLTMRGVQPFLETAGGIKTQLEYVVGGSGNVARTELYNAPPDGYTMLTEAAPAAALGELVSKGQYKSNEFEPIYGWSIEGWQICTKKGSAVKNLKDLAALAKTRPIIAASIGRGGASHLQLILLGEVTGIKMNIVHFSGSAQAYPQVIGRNVDIACTGPGSASRAADRLQFLCVFRDHEPALPDVPSAKQQGFPVPSIDQIWYADTAPKVPEDRLAKLEAAFAKACTAPGFAEAQAKAGILSIEQLDRKRLAGLLKEGYALAVKYRKDLTQ